MDNQFGTYEDSVEETKMKELEVKIERMDEGLKRMYEFGQLNRKKVEALEPKVNWIEFENQIRHDREIELRQEKARKKAAAVNNITTILMMITFGLAFVGVVALTIGL